MKNKKCLIVAAAPENNLDYVREWIELYHPVIFCADDGLKHLKKLQIEPDWLIGDLDSISVPHTIHSKLLKLPCEKDEYDAQVCVRKAIELGFRDLTLVCASGGRIDHFLCNLSILEMAEELGAKCQFLDHENLIFFHPGGQQIYKRKNYRYVGIIPLDPVLTDVTLIGLKYPLSHGTLYRKHIISISNEPVDENFSIEIGSGKALVIFSERQ